MMEKQILRGRLWFGSMDNLERNVEMFGSLYCLNNKLKLHQSG